MPIEHPARRPRRSAVGLRRESPAWRTLALATAPVLLAGLTACSGGSGPVTVPGTAGPAGVSGPTTTAAATTPASAAAQWAGSTQFLQVKGAEKKGGDDYLQVRLAEKKSLGESFETVTLGGAWIDVPISPEAENVPKKGRPTKAAQFIAALGERTASEVEQGFDVTFDDQGQVSQMTWLYVTSREKTNATIAHWAGSTQFLQIQSAREQDDITYIKVRRAEKRSLGESFETVTVGGPWTEVVLNALFDNVPLRGDPGDASQLRAQLKNRVGTQKNEGFNIAFDSTGQVIKITWLFSPAGG
jgi:hypothetical protein